ncbi:MAG: hypothetical protein C0402_04995 [Thermodesulfovibrio sp.]|nr:hypothetical protein [Thermodesulfovibrio sp.]
MNRKYHSLILISFVLVALISCGGTGGAPGSDTADTGIMIQSAILSRTSPDIDTFRDCCSVDATTGACASAEVFTREDATLTVITSNLTAGVTSAHFPASVEECTVTYIKANEDPAAPIIEKLTIFPNCKLSDGSNTCAVTLIDIARKLQYSTPVFVTGTHIPAEQPTHYVAKFSCNYINNFGKAGHFEAEIDLWLSNFDNC